jgi:hypothetical protein
MGGQTVPYLRRRPPRRPEPQAVAPSSPTLSLRPPPAPEQALRRVRRAEGAVRLERTSPMVVLDRFQSSIGSLEILTKATPHGLDLVWEMADRSHGDAADVPLDAGRRLVVSRGRAGQYVVGLRHARALRSLVLVTQGVGPVTLALLDGTTVTCGPDMTVLQVLQHDGELYLRYDDTEYASFAHVRTAYGY